MAAVAASAMAAEWEPLGPFGGSAAIVQVDRRPGVVVAATSDAQIYRSEDNGDSWKALPLPARSRASLHALVVDRRHPGVYFVGLSSETPKYSGIMRSSDSGMTWARIPEPGLTKVWSIAVWQKDSRVMAAGGENGLWLTRDGGETWAQVAPRQNPEMNPVVSLTFDPWDSNILYAGTPHLAWKTADGGASWRSVHDKMRDDSDVFSILVDDRRRRRIFAATCGGIYRSLDGGAGWTRLSGPNASIRTYHIAQNPLQPNVLLAGTSLGLIKSLDSGDTWKKISSQSTRWIAFDPVNPNRVFAATVEAGLQRSDDAGESFRAINQGFSNRRFASLAVVENSLYVTTLTAGGTAILRRSDSDTAWKELRAQPWTEQPGRQAISVDPVHGFSQLLEDDFWVRDVITTEGGDLLAATSRGLARSRDAGLTWKVEPGTLDGTSLSALSRHPTRPGVLFASTFAGIFLSSDGARTWTRLAQDHECPDDLIALLVLPGSPERLLALSRSRGVYAMELPWGGPY
jgi:photosystem II stability/assembly factor-like uncharacterized protein